MRLSAIPHDSHESHKTHGVTVNLRVRQYHSQNATDRLGFKTHATHFGTTPVSSCVSTENTETHWGEVRPCYDVIWLQKFVPNI